MNVHSIVHDGKRIVAIGKVPAVTVDYFARNAHNLGALTARQE